MSKEFERKIERYVKQLTSAKSIEDRVKVLTEFRTYLMGAIDSQDDPLRRDIGYLFINDLQLLEVLLNIEQRLTHLEGRVARIEDELELREKYR
jgi:uncharacterized small protein (DUF1192 family)